MVEKRVASPRRNDDVFFSIVMMVVVGCLVTKGVYTLWFV